MATLIKVKGSGQGGYEFPNGMKWEQSNITGVGFEGLYYADGIWVAGTASGLYYSPTWEAPPVKIVEEWVLKSTVATGMTTDGESKTHEAEFISGPNNATFDALRIYTIFDSEIT